MSGPGGAAPDGVARIAAAFAGHGRRAALMPYLMGGFPDVESSRLCGEACADAGADLIELGIPFSDPLADGPPIHAAATRALAAGVTVEEVLGVCRSLSERLPVVLFAYANLALSPAPEAFVARALEAGAAGLIVPDLPHEESEPLREACDAAGLALVALAAPNTPPERMAAIGASARGFVYTVSLAGTTGERGALPADLADTLGRVRAATDLPVAVGFGISTAEQAGEVAAVADGVIVGSRVVRAAGRAGRKRSGTLVAELAEALALLGRVEGARW
ncbi:MAG: tryptophan synthase subunit alpha [Thermoleophilaceae bacterium]